MSRWILVPCMLASLAFPAYATGIIGAGLGPAFTTYSLKLKPDTGPSLELDRKNIFGFATDAYLGFDLNATTFVTLFWKVNWIRFETDFQMYFAANSNTGLGLLKYFSEADASPFLLVGFGYSGLADLSQRGEKSTPGIAPTLGLGYELKKHCGVQAAVFYNNPSPENTGDGLTVHMSAWSFQLNFIFQNR